MSPSSPTSAPSSPTPADPTHPLPRVTSSAPSGLGRPPTRMPPPEPTSVATSRRRSRGAILENESAPPASGPLGVVAHEQEARPRRLLGKRPRGSSSVQAATCARSSRRPTPLRMDPRQSNAGEGSQGELPGGNHNVPMMNPSGYAPEGFQQGQMQEAYVQHLEEVIAPTANTRSKKSVTRKKLGNFNADEDTNLVKAWLKISCDPITSTGQKRERMWQRIMDRYNSRRASNPVRTVRSLQSRWDKIRAEVNLFASYYADSVRENPSGMSNVDKTTHAVSNFAVALKRKFGFLHCWELMKDAPKWQDPNARDIASAARGEGFGEATTAGDDTMDLTEGQASPVRAGAQARRPMGRDSAKAANKKANSDAGSSSSAEYAARMQDLSLQRISIMQEESVRRNERVQQPASIDEKRFEEMRRHNEALIQIEQEKIRFEQEKIRFMCEQHKDKRRKEEKKEDERILQIDLDACPPNLRLYYQTCQEEILERQAARRRRTQE